MPRQVSVHELTSNFSKPHCASPLRPLALVRPLALARVQLGTIRRLPAQIPCSTFVRSVFAQCPEDHPPLDTGWSPGDVERAFTRHDLTLPPEWEWTLSRSPCGFREANWHRGCQPRRLHPVLRQSLARSHDQSRQRSRPSPPPSLPTRAASRR